MSKQTVAQAQAPAQENPTVLIRYQPENAPLVLATNTTKMLARIQTVKAITNARQLESVSEIIEDARITSDEVETFLESLRAGIQRATERVREMPGYEDFEATLTIKKWGLRTLLNSGIASLRTIRARFISDEQERVRREQLEADAKQDRINKEAAAKAAEAARKQGASKATQQEIKEAIKETPAPIVTSKVLDTATSSVRYQYAAEIVNLKSFLGACLNNPVLLATLSKAIPDIEKAFRSMATDQKEAFAYPGITVRKTPIDVGARR